MDKQHLLLVADRPGGRLDWAPVESRLGADLGAAVQTTVWTGRGAICTSVERPFDLLVGTHPATPRPPVAFAHSLCLPSTLELEHSESPATERATIDWDVRCFGGHEEPVPGELGDLGARGSSSLRTMELLTGVPRLDALALGGRATEPLRQLGIDPHLPTLLVAYAADELEAEWLRTLGEGGPWNLLVQGAAGHSDALDRELAPLPRARQVPTGGLLALLPSADLLLTDRGSLAEVYALRDRPQLYRPRPRTDEVVERVRQALLPSAREVGRAERPPAPRFHRPGEATEVCARIVRSLLELTSLHAEGPSSLSGAGRHRGRNAWAPSPHDLGGQGRR